MAWARVDAGSHQRVEDSQFENLLLKVSRLPRITGVSLDAGELPLRTYVERVFDSEKDFRHNSYNIDLHIFGNELINLPKKYVGLF